MPPALPVAVVACMDARMDVYRILGLEVGDANVIRNAGGVVTDWHGSSTRLALMSSAICRIRLPARWPRAGSVRSHAAWQPPAIRPVSGG